MGTNDKSIELRASLWMVVGNQNFGGPGRIALLACIAECGSITQAAKAIKIATRPHGMQSTA